jgi:predicted DNA-binding transcriptional regulator AlpA
MSLEHSPAREDKNGHTGNIGRMLISDLETAKLLGCSRATVWRRVADGSLPQPVKFGGLSRFVLSEVRSRIADAMAIRDGEEA